MPPGPSSSAPALPSNVDIEAVIQAATSSSGQLSPASRDTRTQLFVGNLPYRVRWQDLKDLFRKAGTVLRADVSLGPDNRSRGYGTVLLASSEDARKAIDMFNGFSWQTRTLEVRSDRIPPDLDLSNPLNALQFSKAQNSSGHVYPFIPPINGAFVNMDPVTAQIHARAAAEAQQALGLPVASPIPPSTVPSVHMSPNISATGAGRMLFVGNLPFHCQWQELKDLFRTAGQIVRADVALGPDGRSRGFGTVLFANDVDAAAAVAMFNGYEYNGRTLKVHHDKFSQGGDTPLLSPLSGQSTNMPASPIPDFNLGRGLSSPSFAQQQHLGAQQYSMSGGSSPAPFYMTSRPGSPYDTNFAHRFLHPPPPPPQQQQQHHHDFAHTPGAPLFHAQHAPYLQHLRSNLASPAPLRAPPKVTAANSVTKTGDQAQHVESLASGSSSKDSTPGSTTGGSESSSQPSASTSSATQGTSSRQPPGMISLPTQSFSVPNPMSPHMTRGIPITPSMPGFNFHAPMSTPPLPHHHLLSPGLGPFSPPLAFYNPYMNPAPGAPLHAGQDAPQSMFTHVFGPPSPHNLNNGYQQQQQQQQGGEIEYFQLVPSPFYLAPMSTSPHHQQQQGSEPQDYFGGAVSAALPTEPIALAPAPPVVSVPPSMPVGRTSSGSAGAGSRSGTVPSSSAASSPMGGGQEGISSRGTSLQTDNEDFFKAGPADVDIPVSASVGAFEPRRLVHPQPGAAGPSGGGSHHGRAKSQSPNESVPSLALSQFANSAASERRNSWQDTGGLQRSLARMSLGTSLEGSREGSLSRTGKPSSTNTNTKSKR